MRTDGLEKIIGKTIHSVVTSESEWTMLEPRTHVFLTFTDGTYFEFYGHVNPSGRVDLGGEDDAVAYARKMGGEVTRVPERRDRPTRRRELRLVTSVPRDV